MELRRRLVFATFLLCACGEAADPGDHDPIPLDAGPNTCDPASDAACTGADIVTSCGAREEHFQTRGGSHVAGDVMYDDIPPVAGNHNPNWARWGVHDDAVPDQCFVHNLEHGGVVFLYHCPEGCESEVTAMKELVEGRPFALLTPYAALPSRFAVVSWGHRLVSECFDRAAFEAFFAKHVDMAPESLSIEPSVECTGG